MKHAPLILVFAIGLPWCGCSSATSKIRGLWGDSASTVDIPSARFTATQGEAVEGDALAQFRLGEWYRTGEEVKRDTAQAYAWFTISARNGHPQAKARVRAGWNGTTFARGKEIAEILIDKYPRAIAFALEGAYENNSPNGIFTLNLLNSRKSVFRLVTDSGVNDFEVEGTWTYNNGEVEVKGDAGKDIYLINTNGDLTMIAMIRDGMREDLPNLEVNRMKKIE